MFVRGPYGARAGPVHGTYRHRTGRHTGPPIGWVSLGNGVRGSWASQGVVRRWHSRELSQGDAGSNQPWRYCMHSSGRCALQALLQMSDAAQPNFSSCAYDVTIHTLTKTARVIVCVHVMHERIPSPRKVSDWLILQLRRGFQYDPIFGDYRCAWIRGVRRVSSS